MKRRGFPLRLAGPDGAEQNQHGDGDRKKFHGAMIAALV
jgi:hypothetical protein